METKTYLFPDVNCNFADILAENERFKSRIDALFAPPTEADILDAAQKIYEVKKAIGLACMYEGGADDIAVDYDIDKESAKAAIEAFMKGRGV